MVLWIGFAEVQNEVKKLNSIICESLIEHGIPVIAIPPSSFITSHNKRIYDFDLNLIKTYLREGFVPVLFGDVVIDDEVKIAVLLMMKLRLQLYLEIKCFNTLLSS